MQLYFGMMMMIMILIIVLAKSFVFIHTILQKCNRPLFIIFGSTVANVSSDDEKMFMKNSVYIGSARSVEG